MTFRVGVHKLHLFDMPQQRRMDQPTRAVLSPELKAFYENHNISVESLLNESGSSVRFIRLNPRFSATDTLSQLPDASPIPWLHAKFGFYSIPSNIKLQQSECFRSGRVYGMDVSSGAAVAVLMSSLYDKEPHSQCREHAQLPPEPRRVLDLCCAPGLKLCMIADLLADQKSTVVGVDISESRIFLCRNIIKKYHVDPITSGKTMDTDATIRLYCADGVTFGTKSPTLMFDSNEAFIEQQNTAGKRKRMNKSARAREQKRLKLLDASPQEHGSPMEMSHFDRVLVDAECSTDGSLKHLHQQLKKTNHDVENQQLTDEKQLEVLVQLQKGLIASGYRLLRPGGILVYSTCSLSVAQNETVVQWLLDKEKDAFLIPLDFGNENFIKEGSIAGTLRFVPSKTDAFSGGGFFVAKIRKISSA
jgi:16S rRNA C967 or C1407 C5-methylase (RsmB/RsmF family)